MEFWTTIITIVLSGIIIYLYKSMTYFKRYKILHKTPIPFLGHMGPVMFRKYHFIEYVSRYTNNWPEAKYVGFYMFGKPAIVVSDTELIKTMTIKHFDSFHDHDVFVNEETDPLFSRGLFSQKGAKWRESRAILSPAFTANKMRQMFQLMTACARNFTKFIDHNIEQNNSDIEIKDAFSKYTIDVIATCAFGISINSLENPNNEFFVLGKRALQLDTGQTFKMMISRIIPISTKIFNLQLFDSELTDFFYNLVKTTVETRKKENIIRPDMLQLMIDSADKTNGATMDIVEMTSQAFLFFLGGFETTSSLMAYTAIELAKNENIQNRLLKDIDEVMTKTKGNPNYDDINSMPYLEALLYETLRYYPIAGFMDRVCVKNFELPPSLPGMKPFELKVGDVVWFPSYRIHKDSKYYEDPETYNPDNFVDQKMNINMPTFLGFGIGPRSCIGNRFALLETKVALFYLLKNFKLEISSKLKQPITYTKTSLIALIEGGFWVKISKRN